MTNSERNEHIASEPVRPNVYDVEECDKVIEANRVAHLEFIRNFDYRSAMVAWVKSARDSGDKSSPPVQIVGHLDLLAKSWGWDRLVPMHGPVKMPIYMNYLKEYYSRNALDYVAAEQNPEEWPLECAVRAQQIAANGSGNGNGLAAAAKFCLKMEEQFMSVWKTQAKKQTMPTVILLSGIIQERARLLISTEVEFSDVAAAAFVCIGKEADLMCEMLRLEAEPTEFIEMTDAIRMCALNLMNYRGCKSVAAAAAMVGIAKEAKLMCEWMRKEDDLIVSYDPSVPQDILECDVIRDTTFCLMFSIADDSSSSAAAATAVPKPDKVESASEIAHDGNGNGIAVAEAAKSTGGNTDKLKYQDHKWKKAEKRKRKRNNKNKKQTTEDSKNNQE